MLSFIRSRIICVRKDDIKTLRTAPYISIFPPHEVSETLEKQLIETSPMFCVAASRVDTKIV